MGYIPNKINGNHTHLSKAISKERRLYLNLANAIPTGIYRLRVFHEGGTTEERWHSTDDVPYKIEFVNDRFCEILNLDKQAFEKNPGIINLLI